MRFILGKVYKEWYCHPYTQLVFYLDCEDQLEVSSDQNIRWRFQTFLSNKE